MLLLRPHLFIDQSLLNNIKPSRADRTVSFSFSFFQEADEHRFRGHEPVSHAANPEPPVLPPGEGAPGADGAGGDQTDLPEGEGDDSGRTELRQRRRGG